jgi:hypothetical protein
LRLKNSIRSGVEATLPVGPEAWPAQLDSCRGSRLARPQDRLTALTAQAKKYSDVDPALAKTAP